MTEYSHHRKDPFCYTRPDYRKGRKLTAVKAYTINNESRFILVFGVPSYSLAEELTKRLSTCGPIVQLEEQTDYPNLEPFTEVFKVEFSRIHSARWTCGHQIFVFPLTRPFTNVFRVAKRRFDDYNFYGGSLHICYAPEFESVADVRDKFELRRKETDRQLRRYQDDTKRLKAETGANRQSTLDQKPLPKKCITEPFVESTNYSADLPGCSNWIPTMLPSLPVRVGTVRGRDAVAQALWQHSALERNSLTQTESNSAEKLSPPEESTLKQQKKRRNADKTNETWWAEKQKWKEKYRQQLRLIVDKCKTSQKDHEANQPEISKGLPISFVSSKAIDFCSPPPRRTLKFVPITKLNEITFDTQQND